MWWSKSERRGFERDSESQAVVAEYRASVLRDTTSMAVPRRKFLCGQPAADDTQSMTTNAENTSATEPLILTPVELERVGELTWTKVEKGARSEPGQAPPQIVTNNPFNAIAPPNIDNEPAQPCTPAATAPNRKPAAITPKRSRGAAPKLTATDVQQIIKGVKEARRQETAQ